MIATLDPIAASFQRSGLSMALYEERIAWKFGYPETPGAFTGDDKRCAVCGSARRDHTGNVPLLFCPTENRLASAPPVPPSLERAIVRHASNAKASIYFDPEHPPRHKPRSRRRNDNRGGYPALLTLDHAS